MIEREEFDKWLLDKNKQITELTAKIKVAEESELLALRNNDGLRVQISELTAKLDKAREALNRCLGMDDYFARAIIEKALEELSK